MNDFYMVQIKGIHTWNSVVRGRFIDLNKAIERKNEITTKRPTAEVRIVKYHYIDKNTVVCEEV